MNLQIRANYQTICHEAAQIIAQLVRQKPNCVLGLATGSTPIGVYNELVRLHREEGLDFSRVTTFNLDEYFPISPDAPQSYRRFMREHLFDKINCANWHVPNGKLRDKAHVERDCEEYEKAIADAGGLDLQLLGIGRTGHIGFNEPGASRESSTRLVVLDHLTRADAANDFHGLENVPVRAVTMGIGTILQSRQIVIMASGARKADIVQEAIEGKITSKVPASFLREHANTHWFLDESAASQLIEYSKPWRAANADLSDFGLQRRALFAAAQELDKPLSKLSARDLEETGSGRLAREVPSPEAAIQGVETDLKARLSDEHLPRNSNVLCLSPHPDDDVICCGATLLKLAERNNKVFVAYGVSGFHAVRDKDVLRSLRARDPRFVSHLEKAEPTRSFEEVSAQVRQFIFERDGEEDDTLLRDLKRLVREGEAADSCRKMNATPLFLDLPFYYEHDKQLSSRDVEIMLAALQQVQPDLVLLTGELNDPHGTHSLCGEAFDRAAIEYSNGGGKGFHHWNYRGAWDEFALWQGDFFSVFGKSLMERKVELILDHISQLEPMFPGGSDPREFYETRPRPQSRQRPTTATIGRFATVAFLRPNLR